MSSRDLSRVVELSFKAFELHEKRHYVRGVAKFAAATAAAQELAQEDCLIVVHLQLMHHLMLHGCAQTPGITAEAAAAAEKQSFELLLSVIATLERRRAAGTLVAGTCRRWPEEEWYGKFIQHRELLHKHPPYPPKRQALLAQFVGYDAYLYATAASLGALESQTSASSSEARAREVCGPFAVRGIDLLEQPRLKIWNDSSLASEDMLANLMQLFSETYSPILAKFGDIQPPESIHPMSEVLSRWQRCVRSGVLQKRDLAAGAMHAADVTSTLHAASLARMAAATLKCCSLQSCASRELHPGHYKQCGACKTVVYCCREHQLEHWPDHKAACKAARKAAAEGQ